MDVLSLRVALKHLSKKLRFKKRKEKKLRCQSRTCSGFSANRDKICLSNFLGQIICRQKCNLIFGKIEILHCVEKNFSNL